jgi:hypothetical protein
MGLLSCITAAFLLCASCTEHKANRLYEQAAEHVEQSEMREAVDIYREILNRYPETDAALRARRQIVLYDGIADAVAAFPARATRELLVATARALDSYRRRNRGWPDSLDRLSPRYLEQPPIDPWGRMIVYEPEAGGRGYKLRCYGADGRAGGDDDAADWLVEDGRFLLDPG